MKSSLSIRQECLKANTRQLGSLLMLCGARIALIFPMANLPTLIGPVGMTTSCEGLPLSILIVSVLVILCNCHMSIPTGYLQTVHIWGSPKLAFSLIVLLLPFIMDLIQSLEWEHGVALPTTQPPEISSSSWCHMVDDDGHLVGLWNLLFGNSGFCSYYHFPCECLLSNRQQTPCW